MSPTYSEIMATLPTPAALPTEAQIDEARACIAGYVIAREQVGEPQPLLREALQHLAGNEPD